MLATVMWQASCTGSSHWYVCEERTSTAKGHSLSSFGQSPVFLCVLIINTHTRTLEFLLWNVNVNVCLLEKCRHRKVERKSNPALTWMFLCVSDCADLQLCLHVWFKLTQICPIWPLILQFKWQAVGSVIESLKKDKTDLFLVLWETKYITEQQREKQQSVVCSPS